MKRKIISMLMAMVILLTTLEVSTFVMEGVSGEANGKRVVDDIEKSEREEISDMGKSDVEEEIVVLSEELNRARTSSMK